MRRLRIELLSIRHGRRSGLASGRHHPVSAVPMQDAAPRSAGWATRPYTLFRIVPSRRPDHHPPVRLRFSKAAWNVCAACRFNGVLLNLYRDGRDSPWAGTPTTRHRSAPAPVIASVSLGACAPHALQAEAAFQAPRLSGIDLPSGSVLRHESGHTQANWLHAIAKTAKPVGAADQSDVSGRSI